MTTIDLTATLIDAYGGYSPRTKEASRIVRDVNKALKSGNSSATIKCADGSGIRLSAIRNKEGVLQFRSRWGWEIVSAYHPCSIEF